VVASNVDSAIAEAKKEKKTNIQGFHDIHEFTKSFSGERKLFVFSITHGYLTDEVIEKLRGELKKGDIVLDGGNEHYRNTERRQKDMAGMGVSWIGTGVSGGYQSVRRGPSMSPGGDKDAVDLVLPLLRKFAAKAKGPKGEEIACVANIGPAGSGHYVKMVHNGIENGMLAALCEVWELLHASLGLPNDEIGKVFEKWNAEGELRGTYLVQIGAEIC
jgi:6-phosphogluconate dehydrogenase